MTQMQKLLKAKKFYVAAQKKWATIDGGYEYVDYNIYLSRPSWPREGELRTLVGCLSDPESRALAEAVRFWANRQGPVYVNTTPPEIQEVYDLIERLPIDSQVRLFAVHRSGLIAECWL